MRSELHFLPHTKPKTSSRRNSTTQNQLNHSHPGSNLPAFHSPPNPLNQQVRKTPQRLRSNVIQVAQYRAHGNILQRRRTTPRKRPCGFLATAFVEEGCDFRLWGLDDVLAEDEAACLVEVVSGHVCVGVDGCGLDSALMSGYCAGIWIMAWENEMMMVMVRIRSIFKMSLKRFRSLWGYTILMQYDMSAIISHIKCWR